MTQHAKPPRFGITITSSPAQPEQTPRLPGLVVITAHCRICRAPFESTDDTRKLCDEHLVECINGAGILDDDDDDLFSTPPPRRAPVVAHITCRVCGKPAIQSIDTAGLLCSLCRSDLDATARHVAGVRAKARDAKMREWAERAEIEIEAARV